MNYFIAHCLNSFPAKGGVSDTISPGGMIGGFVLDASKIANWNLVNTCRLMKKMHPVIA